jgi:hypothetical protein
MSDTKTITDVGAGKLALERLLDALALRPIKADLLPLVRSLNIMAGKEWTWRYLHAVSRGTLEAGADLLAAIEKHHEIRPVPDNWIDRRVCRECGRTFPANHPARVYCPICRPPRPA